MDHECPRYRHVFRSGARELVRLWRLIKNIKSFDRALVEASLRGIMSGLTSPGKGVLLMDMGVCDALIPLLTLKSSKKRVLISLSLHILTILSLTGENFMTIAVNPLFCSLLHDFLKSKPGEQKLAGRIICNMFKQFPRNEAILLSNDAALNLLVMVLRLPFVSSILMALATFEELTYHGENVETLITNFGVEHELSFLGSLEEYILSDQEDIQQATLVVLLNCLSFVDSTAVRTAVLQHSLHIESMLVQLFQDDRTLLGKLAQGFQGRPSMKTRSSSVVRRGSTTHRLGSAIASRPYTSLGRELHVDVPTPRRVPIAMRVMAVTRRRQVNLEILWILCRLHGKVRGSKRGMSIHPEDTYDILAGLLSGDL